MFSILKHLKYTLGNKPLTDIIKSLFKSLIIYILEDRKEIDNINYVFKDIHININNYKYIFQTKTSYKLIA